MKNEYPCIIIDDDPDAAEQLNEYIQLIPQLALQHIYHSPVEFLLQLNALHIGTIIFLDIDMPAISGLELADMIQRKCCYIIFTTAHSEYALKSYEVSAKNYLLKPISEKKFIKAVTKLFVELELASTPTPTPLQEEFLFLKTGDNGQKLKVFHRDILFVKGATNYISVVTETDQHLTYMTLTAMNETLAQSSVNFFKVHKSYLVNGDRVTRIVGNMIYIDKHEVTMSPLYKDELVKYIDKHTPPPHR